MSDTRDSGHDEGVMEGMTEKDTPTPKRYTVPEAAKVLGIGTDAVRKRIARSTIPHEKDDDGSVYVYLDTGQDEGHDVRHLERRDRIIAALTERIPQALEPPSDEREAPQTVEEEPERPGPRPATGEAQEGIQRPWWRRLFGG